MLGGNNPNLPIEYGASYKSNTALAANTPDTIFTPAANVNGAIIHDASMASYSGSTSEIDVFIAKSSAPTTIIDGDVILTQTALFSISTGEGGAGKLIRPVKIPAGKGLYYIANNLQSLSIRSVLYTLL